MLRVTKVLGLVSALALAACGQAPLEQGSVSAISEAGRFEAEVRFEGAVQRGENALFVKLAARSDEAVDVELLAVDALMPAHGHHAHAEHIDAVEDGFRATRLELFMTGRWQIELGLGAGSEADLVTFPVDVP